jgi:predicted membrane channel-forming protein YqfA (hemolysin III family)
MRERSAHLLGWVLFIASAAFYLGSSWRSGDTMGFLGSLLFFLACFCFLVPLLRSGR